MDYRNCLKLKQLLDKHHTWPRPRYSGLKERLEQGAAFKSYGEIVEWLKAEYNLELTYATVYDWVHYRLKAKLKVPRPHSALQDVAAVEQFKKTSPLSYWRFKSYLGNPNDCGICVKMKPA